MQPFLQTPLFQSREKCPYEGQRSCGLLRDTGKAAQRKACQQVVQPYALSACLMQQSGCAGAAQGRLYEGGVQTCSDSQPESDDRNSTPLGRRSHSIC